MRTGPPVPRYIGILFAMALSLGCSGSDQGKEAVLKTAGKTVAKIVVVSTEGCVNTPRAKRLLEETANELGAAIEMQSAIISTRGEAEKYQFHGSPTILVNGFDLDPAMRGKKDYGFT